MVAESDYGRTYPSGKNFTDKLNRDWSVFMETLSPQERFLFRKSSTYHQVRATQEAIDLSISKCDVPAVIPETDEILKTAISIAISALSYIRDPPPLTEEQLWDFNRASAAGLPYSKQGYKTKSAVLLAIQPLVLERAFNLSEIPVDTYNDKQEFLTEEDLGRNKVRGVFSTSLHHLVREKIIYGGQNKALMDNHQGRWIQYGMTKQYNGFHRAVEPLERFDYRDESDVSGWDRTAPLIFVYIIRNALLGKLSPVMESLRDYVTKHNITTHVLLPNGMIVRRRTGVNSGRANTTTDNSILHLFILVYMFVRRAHQIDLAVGYYEIFHNAIYLIYSDDKLGSVNLDYWRFSSPEEFMDFSVETYSLFGMVIKESASFFTHTIPGARLDGRHSFLGSYLSYHEGYDLYMPVPRLDKICSSIVYLDQTALDPPQFFAKLIALAQLSAPNYPIFTVIQKFISWYYHEYPEYRPEFEDFMSTQSVSIPDSSSFGRVLTGFESSATCSFERRGLDLKLLMATLKKTSPNKKPKPSPQKKVGNRVKPVQVTDTRGKTQAVFRIPHCAMDYFSALAAPFETPSGVCIPAEVFPLPSQKIKTFLKGRFQAGTTGIGYVIVSPVVTNNGTVITCTSALSVGGPATLFNAFTATTPLTMPQFPLDDAARLAGNFQARVVSYGIRIKYIGKLMDRNGVTTAFEEPDHRNVYSTANIATLNSVNGHPQSTLRRVGGDLWDSEVYYSGPVEPSEIEFVSTANPLGPYLSVICVQGEPADSYEFEYVQHTEIIGTLAVAKTASHADPATFGKILEASKTTAMDGPLDSSRSPSFFSRFMEGAKALGPAILSGGKMVAAVLSANLPAGLLEAASTSENLTRAFSALRGPPAVAYGQSSRSNPLMIGM